MAKSNPVTERLRYWRDLFGDVRKYQRSLVSSDKLFEAWCASVATAGKPSRPLDDHAQSHHGYTYSLAGA